MCPEYADLLPLLESGELTVAETEHIQAHLRACDVCRAAATDLRHAPLLIGRPPTGEWAADVLPAIRARLEGSTPRPVRVRFVAGRAVLVAILLLGVGLVALGVGWAGTPGAHYGSTSAPPAVSAGFPVVEQAVSVGALAPDFSAQTIDGQPVRLSDYRGRVVWLNFWAAWCNVCKAEMAEMDQFYQMYRDAGLVILSADVHESGTAVKDFVTSHPFRWLFFSEMDCETAARYQIYGVPTHLFIDRQGVIRDRFTGPQPAATLQATLTRLLGP